MIEYNNNIQSAEVYCDFCSYSDDFEGDWDEVILGMKTDGWLIIKSDDTYIHKCPCCRGEHANDNAD